MTTDATEVATDVARTRVDPGTTTGPGGSGPGGG